MTAVIEPAAPSVLTFPFVADCAKYAWHYSDQYCLAALPADFVSRYRDRLDEAAIAAIEDQLRFAWLRRGYHVDFRSWEQAVSIADRTAPDKTYWTVWDEAADGLDGHELVDAAGLNEELAGWREGES